MINLVLYLMIFSMVIGFLYMLYFLSNPPKEVK